MTVRWMLGFYAEDDDSPSYEMEAFPQFEFWQPDADTAKREVVRVLEELLEIDANREWVGYWVTDPHEIGKIKPIRVLTTSDIRSRSGPGDSGS